MPLLEGWKGRARQLKQETYALYLACRDPETPWFAKAFVACVVGYALSPIDLIPDFVPVLGYLDDLIIIPLGIAIAVKMIPSPVLDKCRRKAGEEFIQNKPRVWLVAIIIMALWLLALTTTVAFVTQIIID